MTGVPNSFFAFAVQTEQTWFACAAHELGAADDADAETPARMAAMAAMAARVFMRTRNRLAADGSEPSEG